VLVKDQVADGFHNFFRRPDSQFRVGFDVAVHSADAASNVFHIVKPHDPLNVR
jgi:hypothetical protein